MKKAENIAKKHIGKNLTLGIQADFLFFKTA